MLDEKKKSHILLLTSDQKETFLVFSVKKKEY